MKPPKLKRDWVGLVVESKRDLQNGYVRAPAGARFEVKRNYGGLELRSAPCRCCGVRVFISRVAESDVVIVGRKGDPGVAI